MPYNNQHLCLIDCRSIVLYLQHKHQPKRLRVPCTTYRMTEGVTHAKYNGVVIASLDPVAQMKRCADEAMMCLVIKIPDTRYNKIKKRFPELQEVTHG